MTGAIMYISGGRWDGIPGTDRLLAEALAEASPVLWVDQPAPIFRFPDVRSAARASLAGSTEKVAPVIERLRLPAPPLFSSRLGHSLTGWIGQKCMQAALQRSPRAVQAVVNSSPIVSFPAGTRTPKVLHITDDWLAAAELIGFTPALLRAALERNLREADVITAVSEGLAAKISGFAGRPVQVLPNGCQRPDGDRGQTDPNPVAVLVGQLNERLDLDILESVANAGIPLMIVGPRSESSPVVGHRLDALIKHDNVDWRGAVPREEVRKLLLTASVGLTPYSDTDFNRSSFPLKTLEYLSAGLPVVTTDLPSSHAVKCSCLAIAGNPAQFVALVKERLGTRPSPEEVEEMRHLALENSWSSRAGALRKLLSASTEDKLPAYDREGHHE
ncbi:glycosyltransferase [Paenarthrobacter ureafaciens]|jgi:teichuronic acid biosynthesis glycosyltransferase TuaH|uniref:glycosyltransferase n=1 Tax=Paenarthrobacter ureafaciens TaxID=37931 RepID=UPI00140E13DC|nr:glycosyltransferase [Paenarthrobacter ureafaciens]MCX8453881.1 glycosyltransferase [Paenarthrobacter ureafaciens]MCY0971878.1 glycosyltransferase [Paenarthrobacter ureafaciens]